MEADLPLGAVYIYIYIYTHCKQAHLVNKPGRAAFYYWVKSRLSITFASYPFLYFLSRSAVKTGFMLCVDIIEYQHEKCI